MKVKDLVCLILDPVLIYTNEFDANIFDYKEIYRGKFYENDKYKIKGNEAFLEYNVLTIGAFHDTIQICVDDRKENLCLK